MDPMSRWILIVVFIALAIWRLVRYWRLGAIAVWLAANALLWFLLLGLPLP